jgi:hypothetical protein
MTVSPPTSAEAQLERILLATIEELDITPQAYDMATALYQSVGGWLSDHGDAVGGGAWDVYAQGSFNLGTVVRPLGHHTDYDIDLVCLRDIQKTSVSQDELKESVGKALTLWVGEHPEMFGEPIMLEEGKRCWTLIVGTLLHLDVLPAVPNIDYPPTGIEITDTEVRYWLPSNPKGYASWFQERMALEFQSVVAKRRAEARVEDVPVWDIRTTLQRSVQVLKRHRDIFFTDVIGAPELKPPSILITTLAGHAYRGADNLVRATASIVQDMPKYIDVLDGKRVVANPVQPGENFADRWNGDPTRYEAFVNWTARLRTDLSEVLQPRGLHVVKASLGSSFGTDAVEKGMAKVATEDRTLREAGAITFGAAGTLGTGSGPTVKKHGFYGEAD